MDSRVGQSVYYLWSRLKNLNYWRINCQKFGTDIHVHPRGWIPVTLVTP